MIFTKLAPLLLVLLLSSKLMASNIGHMGRLVDGTGTPLTGTADLQFEIHYSNDLTSTGLLCTIVMPAVPLNNGIYHANLNFSSGTGANCDLNDILKNTPATHSVVMRVHETTLALTFDWQNILHVPAALRSEFSAIAESVLDGVITAPKINQMGALNDQVLTWTGSAWEPRAIPPGNEGTVTSVGAGDGLSSGGTAADPILNVNVDGATMEIATDILQVKDLGISTAKLSANAVIPAKMGLNTNQFDPLAPLLTLILDPNGAIGSGISGLGILTNPSFLEITTNQLTLANSGVTPGTYTSLTVDAKGRVTSAGSVSAADLPFIESLETACANGEIYVANTGLVTCQRHLEFVRVGSATNYVELRVPATHTGATSITLPSTSGTTNQILSSDGAGNLVWMDATSAGEGGTVTSVTAGAGLTGGTITTSGTIALGSVGTAGTYGSATQVPVLTTDAYGRVTGVTNTTITGVAPGGAAGGDLTGTYPNPTIATGAVTYAKTNFADGDIPQVKVNGLTTDLAAKEGVITPGTTAQYWRGDKSWQTLDTTAVAEGTNLYYTSARARADAVVDAIVDGVLNIAPSQNAVFDALATKADSSSLSNYVAISGSNMTGSLGLNAQNEVQFRDADSSNYVALRAPTSVAANLVLNLPGSDGSAGQVLSTDGAGNLSWSSSGAGSVTNVTASLPLSSSGGTTPNLSIAQANSTTSGFLSSTDWNTFNNKEPAVAAGTTAQYRRGDKTWQTLNTTAVPEGTNLYYTTARARADAVADAIVDGILNVAPSQNAVADALALKADASSLSNYVLKAGDTMTGDLIVNSKIKANSFSSLPTTQTVKGLTWSRIVDLNEASTLGTSFILNITGTRSNVVWNSTWLVNTSHSFDGYLTLLSSTDYTQSRLRLVINGNGGGFVEFFDQGNGATAGVDQNINISITNFIGSSEALSVFQDGADSTGYTLLPEVTSIAGGLMAQGGAYFGKNVGIGVSTPTALLEIQQSADDTEVFRSARNTSQYLSTFHGTSGNTLKSFSGVNNAKRIVYDSTTDNINSSPTAGVLGHQFKVQNNDVMLINQTGNVGIGTTNPNSKLEVAGQIAGKSYKTRLFEAGGKSSPSCTLSDTNTLGSLTQFCDLAVTFTLTDPATVQINYSITMAPGSSGPNAGSKHLVTGIAINNSIVTTTINGMQVATDEYAYWGNSQSHFSSLPAGTHTIHVGYRTPAGGTSDPSASDWQDRKLQVMILGFQ